MHVQLDNYRSLAVRSSLQYDCPRTRVHHLEHSSSLRAYACVVLSSSLGKASDGVVGNTVLHLSISIFRSCQIIFQTRTSRAPAPFSTFILSNSFFHFTLYCASLRDGVYLARPLRWYACTRLVQNTCTLLRSSRPCCAIEVLTQFFA